MSLIKTTQNIKHFDILRLIELESDQNKAPTKTQHAQDMLLHMIGQITDGKIIKMESQLEDNAQGPTVFVLPGIEGSLNLLKSLISQLKAHIYGLQYEYYDPQDTVAQMAASLLPVFTFTLFIFHPNFFL